METRHNIPESVEILDSIPISRFMWHCKRNPTMVAKSLKVFAHKGCKCVKCGIEATKVVKVKHADGNIAWMVVTENDFMTRDHIIPKALGGSNRLENLQPMCSSCNSVKASAVHDSPQELHELLECINQMKLMLTNVHNVHKGLSFEIERLVKQVKRLTGKQV